MFSFQTYFEGRANKLNVYFFVKYLLHAIMYQALFYVLGMQN